MTTKHTPTPWKAFNRGIECANGYSVATCTTYFQPVGRPEDNAAHIVKCANLHDELVDGLMDAHPHIADDKLRASIGNLITKARGEA